MSFLEKSQWDEIQAVNSYLAQEHQNQPPPAPFPEEYQQQNERIPAQPQRLIDDIAYYDREFYGQDPTGGNGFEMPDILGGIKSFFGGAKDKIFGCTGGKYFIKKLAEKYPKIEFSKIPFVDMNYKDAAAKASESKKLLFLYIHDHKSECCRHVDMDCLTDPNIQSKLKDSFVCLGINVFSDDWKIVNKVFDPPLVPFIGVFYIAHDGKLDIVNTLMGDDINPDSLLQLLLQSDDQYEELLRKDLKNNRVKTQNPDFTLREETNYFERSEHSLSRGQGLTSEVPQPVADVNNDILDPEEEEKKAPPMDLKEIQRQEYEEAVRKDLEKEIQQNIEKAAQKEKEEAEQRK